MKKTVLLLVALSFLAINCGGGTHYRDPAKDRGSMYWGPKEIKRTVTKMTVSLYSYLKNDYKRASLLQVKKIRNRTSEHLDTKMLANEIVSNLIKKRINFIDRSLTEDAIDEMKKGMSGLIDEESAIPMGGLKSPNLYLSGDVSDNVRYVNGRRVQYLVVTLKLVELRTGMLKWQEQKEFLKSTKTDKVSF